MAGVFGVLNQIKMELIMKMMEANPEYEGESPYQKRLVMVNTMFAIIFALNDIVTAEVRTSQKVQCEIYININMHGARL